MEATGRGGKRDLRATDRASLSLPARMEKDSAEGPADLSTAGGGPVPTWLPASPCGAANSITHGLLPPAPPPAVFAPRASPFPFLPAHLSSHTRGRLTGPASLYPSPRLHTSCWHNQQLLGASGVFVPLPGRPGTHTHLENFQLCTPAKVPSPASCVLSHLSPQIMTNRVISQVGRHCPPSL